MPKMPFGPEELPPDKDVLSPEEQELLRSIAQWVVNRRFTVMAIMTLESSKPVSWIGSQTLVFFEPFFTSIFTKQSIVKNYNLFQHMMERRENVERLLQKIEELDAIQLEQEREQKRKLKAERKIKRKRFWRKLFGREKPEDTLPPKV
jgi:hypothetical protein